MVRRLQSEVSLDKDGQEHFLQIHDFEGQTLACVLRDQQLVGSDLKKFIEIHDVLTLEDLESFCELEGSVFIPFPVMWVVQVVRKLFITDLRYLFQEAVVSSEAALQKYNQLTIHPLPLSTVSLTEVFQGLYTIL